MKKKKTLTPQQVVAIKYKKQGTNWSNIIPFDRNSIKELENKAGNYELFDKDKNKLYVGSSLEIKHRVESYDELDDDKVHPTKIPLRPKIAFFRFRYLPIHEARIHERNIKDKLGLKYNMDNTKNMEIKREKHEK